MLPGTELHRRGCSSVNRCQGAANAGTARLAVLAAAPPQAIDGQSATHPHYGIPTPTRADFDTLAIHPMQAEEGGCQRPTNFRASTAIRVTEEPWLNPDLGRIAPFVISQHPCRHNGNSRLGGRQRGPRTQEISAERNTAEPNRPTTRTPCTHRPGRNQTGDRRSR
jgi:hypothetical protein